MASKTREESRESALKELRECCELIKSKAKDGKMSDKTLLAHLQQTIHGFKWKANKGRDDNSSDGFLLNLLLVTGKVIFYVLATVIVLYLIVGAACNLSPSLQKKSHVVMRKYNLIYHYLRLIRLATLPLHRFIDMNKITPAECMFTNPFYVKEPPLCETCSNFTDIDHLAFNDEEINAAIQEYEPIVITGQPGYSNVSYNFDYLKQFFYENQRELDASFFAKFGSSPLKNLEQFFAQTNEELLKSDYSFGWHASHLIGTRTLRKLYIRPDFLPIMAEIVIEKTLLVMSPNTEKNLTMPMPGTGQGLLVQANGKSLVSLVPDPHCAANCTIIEVELNQGEILCYPTSPWDIVIKPLGSVVSVFYNAGFTSTS